ncbi:MAG TPA: hypothetical protein VGZ49_05240 [Xanthobacteraceae bacterium]|jgi:hypothetical protein|nr:hypothetical protein [Xanthobacteraceae bacterium]
MISDDEYLEAIRGNSPEMAFVRLESKYRAKLNANLEGNESSGHFNECVVEYMNHTISAHNALGLDVLDFYSTPARNDSKLYDIFHNFTTVVDEFKVRAQIKNARGILRYSVALKSDEKDKIRTYVMEIKKVIDRSSTLSQRKKERLFDLINDFLAEVDRDRAPWDRFADLVIGVAHLGGEAAQELEPARKLINSIARLLGRSKESEDSTPSRIPAPPKKLSPPEKRDDSDDEIPF